MTLLHSPDYRAREGDFHLPHTSHFFEVSWARDIKFPCVFNGLEEFREDAGERINVAFWHTRRLARLVVR
jgi:hypothetical protein